MVRNAGGWQSPRPRPWVWMELPAELRKAVTSDQGGARAWASRAPFQASRLVFLQEQLFPYLKG